MKTFLDKMREMANKSPSGYVDFDVAEYCLGVALGLWEEKSPHSWDPPGKWVFWSDNTLGNALGKMLHQMVEVGILETPDGGPEFRPTQNPLQILEDK